MNYFLGIEVSYIPNGIFLSQKKFTHGLIDVSNLNLIKKASTPLPSNLKLSAEYGDHLLHPDVYISLVGKLNFVTTTHPDLAYIIPSLS